MTSDLPIRDPSPGLGSAELRAALSGRRLVVGITGGIAAFKTAALVSQLVQHDARVSVVMTAAAQKFVGPATFAALTGRPVATEVFDPAFPLGAHIALAEQCELLCVAPASADLLGKLAHGIADDLLTTLYLAYTGPVLLAPAMNCEMWEKPSVQRNVAQLRSDGLFFVGPEAGWLSCRKQGAGRMAAPESILAAIVDRLGPAGRNVAGASSPSELPPKEAGVGGHR